jgi:hypothetical protein
MEQGWNRRPHLLLSLEWAPEMEFLDINLTKDSNLLLHAIHSLSTGRFLKKFRLYSGFKNTYKKSTNQETQVYLCIAFCRKVDR